MASRSDRLLDNIDILIVSMVAKKNSKDELVIVVAKHDISQSSFTGLPANVSNISDE